MWHMLDNGEFTGVFYNRNICAAWMAACLPFFVAAFRSQIHSKKHLRKNFIALFSLFSISLAMIMSNSRNALGALVLGSLSMFADLFSANYSIGGFKLSRFAVALLAIVVVSLFIVCLGSMYPLKDALGQFFGDDERLEVWKFGVHIASNNILVGTGSGSFANYVSILSPFDSSLNHVHSLPLDLWLSYGFVVMVVFIVYVCYWLFAAMRSGMFHECIFKKAWLISFLLLMIVCATDLPYLDARVNLVGWILFAGIVSHAEPSALKSDVQTRSGFE